MNPHNPEQVTPESPIQSALRNRIDRFRLQIAELDADSMERHALSQFVDEFLEPTAGLLGQEFESANGGYFVLQEIIDRHVVSLSEDRSNQADVQKSLIRELVKVMPNLTGAIYGTSTRQFNEHGKSNCAGISGFITNVLESLKVELGGEVFYVLPYGHAVVLVKCNDGTYWYVDGSNGVAKDVTEILSVDTQEQLDLFELSERTITIPYQYLPRELENWQAMLRSHVGNMMLVPDAASGTFDEAITNIRSDSALAAIQAEAQELVDTYSQGDFDGFKNTKLYLDSLAASDFHASPEGLAEEAFFASLKSSGLFEKMSSLKDAFSTLRASLRASETLTSLFIANHVEIREFILGSSKSLDIEEVPKDVEDTLVLFRETTALARSHFPITEGDIEKYVCTLFTP